MVVREDVKKVEESLVTRPLTGRRMGSVAAAVDHLLAGSLISLMAVMSLVDDSASGTRESRLQQH